MKTKIEMGKKRAKPQFQIPPSYIVIKGKRYRRGTWEAISAAAEAYPPTLKEDDSQ